MQAEEHRAASPTLHIRLLGDFYLLYGGEPLTTVNSARLQSLLAYLVLHREAPQARQHLAFLLWPDSTERQARTNLRKQLHYLRRALPDPDRFLQTDAKTLNWQTDAPFTLDVAEFEKLLTQAERAEGQDALRALLKGAVNRYHGDLLPSCYDDWILSKRERLRQQLNVALDGLITTLENQRAYSEAIAYGQRSLHHDPLQEATYRRLMRLHALNSDRAGALRTYHACATALEQELGAEPSRATQEAYERLLKLEGRPAPAPQSTAPTLPLVGREREWGQLQEAWRKIAGRGAHLALVSGEAGIGKTRLAEELLGWARRQGIASASARCYANGGELAYAPVTAWLRTEALQRGLVSMEPAWLTEVARLLPELLAERPDVPPPGPLIERWQKQRLFEALTRAFPARRQLVLLIDDLQWCDRETLEWLSYLLRAQAPGGRLLVLGTLRTEEMHEDLQFAALLRDLRRSRQLTEIELGALDEAQATTLASHAVGRELESALATVLYRETEGNPLFVVETARAGLPERGEVTAPRWPVPPTVQEVIAGRLDQLSAQARELAGVAATIGREFTFDVLAQASGEDEERLVHGLDELWARRVVREQGTEGYDFSHDKIREVAYGELSAARRRWLHGRVAEALETVYGADLDPVSGQIGAHYEQAGQPEHALSYYQRAAEAAKRIYADQEAIGFFRRAVALLDAPTPGTIVGEKGHGIAAALWEGMGDVLAMTGQHDGARSALRKASSYLAPHDSIGQARLWRKLGSTWQTQLRLEEAMEAYGRAETALGAEPIAAVSEWWREWLMIQLNRLTVHYFGAHTSEMAALREEMRPVVEQYGTPDQRVRFLERLAMANVLRDRYMLTEETVDLARTALTIRQQSGDASSIAYGHFGLGFNLLWHGDLDGAQEHLQVALAFGQQIHYVWLETVCLSYLAMVYRRLGQVEKARDYASRALNLATSNKLPWYASLAKANLAWVAWREGNLAAVKTNAHEARELLQSAEATVFMWTGSLPLIGVALAEGQPGEAVDHARALLKPTQARLPDSLTACLEAAVQAWQDDHPAAAQRHLEQALEHARELGFL